MSKRYTPEELHARLKFFVGVILALTLAGTMGTVLFSIVFVSQPMLNTSPVDQEFFKLIAPIATFLTGVLSGIMLGAEPKHRDDNNEGGQ